MSDIQHETDLEQAKSRLEEVAARKEGAAANPPDPNLLPGRRERDISDNPDDRGIRPVKKKAKKKGFGQKLKEAFLGEDIGDGSITEHIFFRIFIPSFKRVLADMGNSAINMALGLDPKTRTIRSDGGTHVSNAGVYRDRNLNRAGGRTREAVCDYEWDEETAKDIYNQLLEIAEKYDAATLADAYSIMDMPEKIRSTDRNYGWTSAALRRADVYCVDRNRGLWVVDLPPARQI